MSVIHGPYEYQKLTRARFITHMRPVVRSPRRRGPWYMLLVACAVVGLIAQVPLRSLEPPPAPAHTPPPTARPIGDRSAPTFASARHDRAPPRELDCSALARAHGIVPGVSWGTLHDAALRNRWQAERCDDTLWRRGAVGARASATSAGAALPGATSTGSAARIQQPASLLLAAPGAMRLPPVVVFHAGLAGYRVFRIPAIVRHLPRSFHKPSTNLP